MIDILLCLWERIVLAANNVNTNILEIKLVVILMFLLFKATKDIKNPFVGFNLGNLVWILELEDFVHTKKSILNLFHQIPFILKYHSMIMSSVFLIYYSLWPYRVDSPHSIRALLKYHRILCSMIPVNRLLLCAFKWNFDP